MRPCGHDGPRTRTRERGMDACTLCIQAAERAAYDKGARNGRRSRLGRLCRIFCRRHLMPMRRLHTTPTYNACREKGAMATTSNDLIRLYERQRARG